ncbi:hypothetical protein [Streptococcus dysgalactiae]|uniref:hypothetical protein n=1 Tax=Streptococcus dysgalactiae TaxID=1334 RepID=UPI003983C8A4
MTLEGWLILLAIGYGCYRAYKYARNKGMSNSSIVFTTIAGIFVFILGLIKISEYSNKAEQEGINRAPLYKCSACGREVRTRNAIPKISLRNGEELECIGTETGRHLWNRIEN